MPARTSASILLCLVVSSGCATGLQRSIWAYERGDFREAHEILANVDEDEGQELRDAVAGGIEYSSSYLLSQAWVVLERGRTKPYREALAYYQAALEVMPDDHPRRAETEKAVANLERDMEKERERARSLASDFDEAVETSNYERAIGAARELLDLMRSVGVDYLDAEDVLALAEQAMADSEHESAVQLVELADLVRRESYELEQSNIAEIARYAAALRYFKRAEDALEEGVASASGSASKPASRAPPSKPAAEPDPAEREARTRLRRARGLWKAGNKYEALCALDEALAVLGARAGLEDQRRRWEPTRTLLIDEFVERGEMALSREESTEARGWYEKILTLDPTHELAHDRLRKLDKLEELKGSGNR